MLRGLEHLHDHHHHHHLLRGAKRPGGRDAKRPDPHDPGNGAGKPTELAPGQHLHGHRA